MHTYFEDIVPRSFWLASVIEIPTCTLLNIPGRGYVCRGSVVTTIYDSSLSYIIEFTVCGNFQMYCLWSLLCQIMMVTWEKTSWISQKTEKNSIGLQNRSNWKVIQKISYDFILKNFNPLNLPNKYTFFIVNKIENY